jgi:error-prone DNA polymerase
VSGVVPLPAVRRAPRREDAPGFAELGAMSNYTFLEGASHPWELVATAKVLGHAAMGIADRNSFAGLVRGMAASEHVDDKTGQDWRIRFVPGCRVALSDGCEYLVWPTDVAAYGRLARTLSAARCAGRRGFATSPATPSSPPRRGR